MIALLLTTAALVDVAPVRGQSGATIEAVRDGLFMISGDGGNVAVRVTADGVVLVDTGLQGRFAEIERLVATVTPVPIRYVISSHLHPDHTGGNAEIPAGVEVLGHSVTRELMQRNGMPGPPRTVFTDATTLELGDAEVRVLYFGAGHTSGDAVVYFPDVRVVHVGDLVHEIAPFIDYEHGGSSAGWVAVLDRLLELDFDVVIAGHGALADRDEVVAFRSQMETVRSRMRDMISRGALRRDVGPGIVSADLGWTQYRSGGLFRSLAGLYEEIEAELRQSGFRRQRPPQQN